MSTRKPVGYKIWAVLEVEFDDGDNVDVDSNWPVLLGSFDTLEEANDLLVELDPELDDEVRVSVEDVEKAAETFEGGTCFCAKNCQCCDCRAEEICGCDCSCKIVTEVVE